MSIPEFQVGDRVQDAIWDGCYIGTVVKVQPGWVFVRWDNCVVEDQMKPDHINHLNVIEVA